MRKMMMSAALAAAAMVGVTAGAATTTVPEEPTKKQRRSTREQKPVARSYAYPKLNRSRRWKPERSYREAAETTLSLGFRTTPLR